MFAHQLHFSVRHQLPLNALPWLPCCGMHPRRTWVGDTHGTVMDRCHRDHLDASLSIRSPVQAADDGWTCSPVPPTSGCSQITIPTGQATPSQHKPTVTVHRIFFELYILSRLSRLQSFKQRAVWLPPLKTGASGSLKWGCFAKLMQSVQPSILLPIHLSV